MKVGDVVFFEGDGFFSSCIKHYNMINYYCSGWTHVGIITEIKKDNVLINEALSNGFVRNTYSISYVEERIKEGTMKLKTPKKRLTKVKEHADKYLGRGYGWFDIFGITISMLTGFKFLKITGANKLICSEAVSRILYDSSNKKINLSRELNKPYDLITPMDIYLSEF